MTHQPPLRRRSFLSGMGLAGLSALGVGTLAGCSGGSGGSFGQFTWSTWGGPSEVRRLKEFTEDFNKRHPKIQARLVSVPTDGYRSKLQTQLSGGAAPDVFYANDDLLSRLIRDKTVAPLRSRLEGPGSKSPVKDFSEGLWGAARQEDGEIYGVPVDCNPIVMWFNKSVLADAGVGEEPTRTFESGNWNRDTFQSVAEKIRDNGKSAAAVGSDWLGVYAWLTAGGGKVYDEDSFVAHEDPKSVEAFEWLHEMLESKTFTYIGSLPEGQGQEALFMSNNVGFATGVGRWLLPVISESSGLEYDIVPYPSADGSLPSTPMATAYMAINAKAVKKEEAFQFLTDFVSVAGQRFRLAGAGNAVPSIEGAEDVLAESDTPETVQYWFDLRAKGYSLPIPEARTPGLSDAISRKIDVLWTGGGGNARAALRDIGENANRMITEAGA
ncbi:sugar ABC transporter substrate-binding protein [Streptomyces enissocaesilis]|uniref:Extracellular solute-binding protein n=1 Tax=Streptomyces enissocaesilis TaxID=332589 RepID=A0ABP6K8E4_9ACTN